MKFDVVASGISTAGNLYSFILKERKERELWKEEKWGNKRSVCNSWEFIKDLQNR